MSDVEDYRTGRVLGGVVEKEKLLEKLRSSDDDAFREELERREEGAEKRHFTPDMDTLRNLIGDSERIAVGPRVCLGVHEACKRPQNSVFLDELAEALVEEGKAEYVGKEKAIEVLEKGRDEGHTHILTKVSGKPMELCNSCENCCILWKLERMDIDCISEGKFSP